MTNSQLAHRATLPKLTTQLDYILVDGSSSMTAKWWDTLAAVEAYVSTTRGENIHSQVILHEFSGHDQADYIAHNIGIADWSSLIDNPIGLFGGMTALYDAVYLMGLRLRDLDPPRCSIVIVTDGEENDSHFTNMVQAKAVLDWCRAKGWQVTFIGADFNNSDQASLLGAHSQSAIGVQQRLLVDAARNLAKKRASYGLFGTPMHWSEDERQQFGGYLAAPST